MSPRLPLPLRVAGCAAVLRPWRGEDLGALRASAGEIHLRDFRIPYPCPRRALAAWLAGAVAAGERSLAIEIDAAAVGGLNLQQGAAACCGRALELGFWLAAPLHGCGIMSAVLAAFAPAALASFELDCLLASVYADGGASLRVLEKVGFAHRETRLSVLRDAAGEPLAVHLLAREAPVRTRGARSWPQGS